MNNNVVFFLFSPFINDTLKIDLKKKKEKEDESQESIHSFCSANQNI